MSYYPGLPMETPLRHYCLIHEGAPSIQVHLLAPFLAQGVLAGGRALFVGSPTMAAELRARLNEAHFPSDTEIRRGALVFITDRDHLVNGRFDVASYLARIEELYYQTLDEGYSGLWGSGDIRWEFGETKNLSAVLEYETKLEALFDQLPQLYALCHYHKNTLPLQSIGSALLSHRGVYLSDQRVRRNPFFASPQPVLQHAPTQRQVEQMLDILTKR